MFVNTQSASSDIVYTGYIVYVYITYIKDLDKTEKAPILIKGFQMILWADREGLDQPAQMRRLIWAFAVRIYVEWEFALICLYLFIYMF